MLVRDELEEAQIPAEMVDHHGGDRDAARDVDGVPALRRVDPMRGGGRCKAGGSSMCCRIAGKMDPADLPDSLGVPSWAAFSGALAPCDRKGECSFAAVPPYIRGMTNQIALELQRIVDGDPDGRVHRRGISTESGVPDFRSRTAPGCATSRSRSRHFCAARRRGGRHGGASSPWTTCIAGARPGIGHRPSPALSARGKMSADHHPEYRRPAPSFGRADGAVDRTPWQRQPMRLASPCGRRHELDWVRERFEAPAKRRYASRAAAS